MRTNLDYKIQLLDRKDIDELVDLFVLVWNSDYSLTYSKTKWAFDNNDSIVLVARDIESNNLIGARGAMHWPIQMSDKVLNTYQFHGTCVHPNYQRKGIFTELNKNFLEYAEKNNIYGVFNVSVEASMLGYQKLGWNYLPGFERLIKPINFPNILKLGIHMLSKKGGYSKNELVNIEKSQTLNMSDSKLQSFLEKRSSRLSLSKIAFCFYDLEFFKKRISDQSGGYRFFYNDNIFIIYKRARKFGLNVLLIGDIMFINESLSEIKAAFKEIIKENGPDLLITYISKNHPNYKMLKKCGLFPSIRNDMNFGTKIVNKKNENYFGDSVWNATIFDIDTF